MMKEKINTKRKVKFYSDCGRHKYDDFYMTEIVYENDDTCLCKSNINELILFDKHTHKVLTENNGNYYAENYELGTDICSLIDFLNSKTREELLKDFDQLNIMFKPIFMGNGKKSEEEELKIKDELETAFSLLSGLQQGHPDMEKKFIDDQHYVIEKIVIEIAVALGVNITLNEKQYKD